MGSRGQVSPSLTPPRREANLSRGGPFGDHAQCVSSGLGLECPRGVLRSRLLPLRSRRPFSVALKPLCWQDTPGSPCRRVSDQGGGPEVSLPPREKVQGDHSPVGAAGAAAVPEVPEGAPKLKAISREQETGEPKRCSRRHWVLSAFRSGGETAPNQAIPPLFWPSL